MDAFPFVIDVGTSTIKADLGSSDEPVLYRNAVGRVRFPRPFHSQHAAFANNNSNLSTATASGTAATTNSASNETSRDSAKTTSTQAPTIIVGKELEALKGVARVTHPMEHGHVTNYDDLEHLLRHIIFDRAKITPQDHFFFLTEPVGTSDEQRRKLSQFLFDQVHCAGIIFGVQPVLSLHATGRTTGLVVECGEGVTQTCAVYDGFSVRDAAQRFDFGGSDVTSYLQHLLRQSGVFLDASSGSDLELLAAIKQRFVKCSATVVTNSSSSDNPTSSSSTTPTTSEQHNDDKFVLPDGSEISVSDSVQKRAGELFFDPTLFSLAFPPLPCVARETLKKCDIHLRTALCGAVHLAGGSTLMMNFAERFASELAQLTPATCKIKVHAATGRQHAAWYGASILSQQASTVSSFCVTRAQFEEVGDSVLKTRLFG